MGVLPAGDVADEGAQTQMRRALATKSGFGIGTNVYFSIDGDVDETTLAGNTFLNDLDGGIPHWGRIKVGVRAL